MKTIETMEEVARQKASQSLTKDNFKPTRPSFFIEWDKDVAQFKIVTKK